MDLNAVADPSHLLTFLLGTAVGAAGKYVADLFTDQRKRKEERHSRDLVFRRHASAMPELFAEMKVDLVREQANYIRELVALPNRGMIYNTDRTRLFYYESEHVGLVGKLEVLAEAGYLNETQRMSVPMYRLTEEFVERLLA